MSKPKNMSLQTFLAHFTKDERADRRYCFIIGAGASKQSGIPTGGELAEIWLREINDLYPSEYEQWIKEKSIDEKNPAPHYPQIYDKRFEIDPKEGFFALTKTMEGREPSCGYSVLVQVLANTDHKVAITTNFDSMIEDAMFTYTQTKPLVCGHESLTSFIKPMITRPLIAKIHRVPFYAPKSSSSETNDLHESWKNALTNILNIYTPLVIGYGGNDGSLMGFLESLEKIEGGVFWFFRENDGEPAEKIKNLVVKHNGYLVPIEGFDEMMLQMNTRLGYDLLDGKIIEVARQRAQRYKEQIENIQKGQAKESDTAMALKETISKGKRSWWSVELEADAEKDIEKRDKIYTEGIKEFSQSSELLNNYANFSWDIKKDYDKSEQYYKRALELDPNNETATGNYALFLNKIKKDYDKAEQYYKRALELDPNYAIATGNYALFLNKIKKDYDKAEQYYKRALALDPNNAITTGDYALFLNKIKKDYDKAEQYYKRALALDPNNAITTGDYALFLNEIKKDYDKAEQYYKKALELDPNYVTATGNYAIFLKNVKKDNDKAEQYYKRALELDPNNADNIGNLAQLMIITGRKEEGKKLINRAFELNSENPNLLAELWFYRYANVYEEYGETAYDELVKLVKAGARSIEWNFKGNIELARKEGHPFIEKLEKLDRIITKDAPPDNL